ncbi:LANO_0H06678g1_1 [Lachancea nothofagi CBS 11611]|uniref:LANO_0H06678g1_1 n=1 Tax=Lachancea nothofagi CBS 11611 TaxID=1266666 RepID=A0A1G4KLE5_9SACH|nr:LANO_0H06678g1_1 [Lachancea nothofagi CBS 11611]
MGRKLKGKIGSKGLKGSLLRHQALEQSKKKTKSKQEHALHKNQPTKASLESRASQREAAGKLIPFEKDSTLLLVGEGDFSFSRAIIMQDYIKAKNLIVTSFDASVSELNLKYPHSFPENYEFLVQNGVKILFRIDATNLLKSFKLSKKTTWPKVVGAEWAIKKVENIMFNFPHTGKGIKDQDKNIRDHQELVAGFLASSKLFFKNVNRIPLSGSAQTYTQGYDLDEKKANDKVTADGYGNVLLTVFTGEPYDSWQLKSLAKTTGWKVERSSKFQWENYPEYAHKRTNSEQDTTKPALDRDARTYTFEIYDKTKHSKAGKLQKLESDEE